MPGKFFLYKYQVGDVVVMRKKHPCGSNRWEVTRIGAECRLKCSGCGHELNMTRAVLEKSTVDVERTAAADE